MWPCNALSDGPKSLRHISKHNKLYNMYISISYYICSSEVMHSLTCSKFIYSEKISQPSNYTAHNRYIYMTSSSLYNIISYYKYRITNIVLQHSLLWLELNNSVILKLALPCHAPHDADRTLAVHLQTIVMHIDSMQK